MGTAIGLGGKFYVTLAVITFIGILYFYLVIIDSISKNQDTISKATKLPYVLSINKIYKGFQFSEANITLRTVLNVDLAQLSILVLDPNGNIDSVTFQDNKKSFLFPSDFENSSKKYERSKKFFSSMKNASPRMIAAAEKDVLQLPQGDYGVILYNASGNSNITSAIFSIIDPLNSISNQFLGTKLLAAIVALSIPATWVYKNVIQRYLERKKEIQTKKEQDLLDAQRKKEQALVESKLRIEKKLSWMHENVKYFSDMLGSSRGICFALARMFDKDVDRMTRVEFKKLLLCYNGQVKNHQKIDEDLTNLLKKILKFLYDFQNFRKDVNYFYFDNMQAEVYLVKLTDIILSQCYDFFSDRLKFITFSYKYRKKIDDPVFMSRALDTEFKSFKNELGRSICKEASHFCSASQVCCHNQTECFYKNLLTLSYLLDICINNVLIVSYSSDSAALDAQIKNKRYKDQTKEHIVSTMHLAFKTSDLDAKKCWNEIFESV